MGKKSTPQLGFVPEEPFKHVSHKAHKPKTQQLSNKELKRRQRKLKKLEEKKEKAQKRDKLLELIKEKSIGNELEQVMQSTRSLGQKETTKERLKKSLLKEKLGLSFDQDLFQEHEVQSDWNEEPDPVIPLPSKKQKSEPPREPSPEPLFIPLQPSKPLPQKPYEVSVTNLPSNFSGLAETHLEASELPIINMEQEIMEAFVHNPFIIVCGETGSGKSTQVPRFLYEKGLQNKIGITQPRRVAAISLAQRVAQETGFELGKEVGYQVRYDSSMMGSKIKFMTDGILMKEIESDFLLKNYSALIIDEAHERSVNTDVLLGLLSRIVPLRQKLVSQGALEEELKVVIMSATLRVEEFVENKALFPFQKPPVINIEARQFPVTVHFSKTTDSSNYLNKALRKTIKIHRQLPEGGILVFLTGKKEVIQLTQELKQVIPEAKVLGLYSQLSKEKQLKVFEPTQKRLIVVSTNVAETSLTIPQIKYVVDTGLEKRKVYSGKLEMSRFKIEWISKASAEQRAGRAGRVSAGHCYRLYSQTAFGLHFEEFRTPPILSTPIGSYVLALKALGIKNTLKFPFPSPPLQQDLLNSLKLLNTLGALKRVRSGQGDVFEITPLGKKMSQLPVAARYSKMLVMAKERGVGEYVLPVVAGMEVEQVFVWDFEGDTPKEKMALAKKQHARWFNPQSDLLAYLKVLLKLAKSPLSVSGFCNKYFLNEKNLSEMLSLAYQLYSLLLEVEKPSLSNFKLQKPSTSQQVEILKSVASGLLDQVAVQVESPDSSYISKKRIPYLPSTPPDKSLYPTDYELPDYIFIHPSSYLFSKAPPQFVCYQSLIFTRRPCMVGVTHLQPQWLFELGGDLVQNLSVLEDPEPQYCPKEDCLKAWVCASFGPSCWKLPPVYSEFPHNERVYYWFLRHLMEGKVVPKHYNWTVKATSVTNPQASGSQKQIASVISQFKKLNILSRKNLLENTHVAPHITQLLPPNEQPKFIEALLSLK